jgi:hypothetical protein
MQQIIKSIYAHLDNPVCSQGQDVWILEIRVIMSIIIVKINSGWQKTSEAG